MRDFEQREKSNYNKTFVFIIKSMLYKTIFALIVVEDLKLEINERQNRFFIIKSRKRFM